MNFYFQFNAKAYYLVKGTLTDILFSYPEYDRLAETKTSLSSGKKQSYTSIHIFMVILIITKLIHI